MHPICALLSLAPLLLPYLSICQALCPNTGKAQRRVLLIINDVIVVAAAFTLFGCLYILLAPDNWAWSYATIEAFANRSWLEATAAIAGTLLAMSVTMVWAATFKKSKMLLTLVVIYCAFVLMQAGRYTTLLCRPLPQPTRNLPRPARFHAI